MPNDTTHAGSRERIAEVIRNKFPDGLRAFPDVELLIAIETLQTIQSHNPPSSRKWQLASEFLEPLFAEMARRERALYSSGPAYMAPCPHCAGVGSVRYPCSGCGSDNSSYYEHHKIFLCPTCAAAGDPC